MKTAVIYYSLDGNCAFLADLIRAEKGADLFRIELAEEDKGLKGLLKIPRGVSMVMGGKRPPIKPLAFKPEDYDLLILGFPVWAGSPAPPMLTFLDSLDLGGRKVALFCSHQGGKGQALAKLKAALRGCMCIGEIDFRSPLRGDKAAVTLRLRAWLKSL